MYHTHILKGPNFSTKKCYLDFIKVGGNSAKMQEHLFNSHTEGRREYDLHTKLKSLQFHGETEAPLKPTDPAHINYKIKQIGNAQEKADALKQEIRQDDIHCFTKKSGKIISGQESAHSFNEECLGKIKTIKSDLLNALTRMESLKDKHKRMCPEAKQNATSRKRWQKENKTKSKNPQAERQEINMKRVFGMIVLPGINSCIYGDIVDTTHLNKSIISSLKKNDLRYLRLMLDKSMFTEQAISVVKTLIPEDFNASDGNSDETDCQYDMYDI